MRRFLTVTAVVVATFAVVIALTFPTDAIVRALLARVPLPSGVQVTFASARLRPSGLRLEDVHVLRTDGRSVFDAVWLQLRPSIVGLLRGSYGRPGRVAVATCQGTITVDVGLDQATTVVAVELENVELAACVPYLYPELDVVGRVSGTVNVRYPPRDPVSGDAALDVRSFVLKPGGSLEDVVVRADAGRLQARGADGRIELVKLEASSDDFQASGNGAVRLVMPRGDSPIDVRLTVTPGRTAPEMFRRWLAAVPGPPPDPSGTRRLRVQGSIGNPRLVAAGTPG